VRVSVVVTDEPGQLAGLFDAAERAGVNVEDVLIEHASGHPVGVVELYVQPAAAGALSTALAAGGWSVHA
jgi:prephenate dehydrogenase